MVGCPSTQTTTIMYLRAVYLKINLKLNNIFYYYLNFAFLSLFIIKSLTHKSVSCHDLAKWLSYYLYLYSFLFLFSSHLDLLYKKEVWESVTWQISHIIVTCQEYHRVTSHDNCGKVVHRLCSSYISSV